MEQSSESSHQSEMDLLALPDLVLLEVLKLLDVGVLLRCRQVCRRLCALALHAYVWSHRYVYLESDLRAALLLAPRVRELHIEIGGLGDTEREELLSATNCAAKSLCVYVESAADAALGASVLHHQVRLGHLQSFICSVMTEFDSPVSDLGNAIVDISGHLRELYFIGMLGSCLASTCTLRVVAPSLQSFVFRACRLGDESRITLEKLLAIHSTTLKRIGAFISENQWQWPTRLKFPQLKKLECMPLDGIDSLLESRSLTSLSLDVRLELASPSALAAAGRLLRLAALEEVRILYGPGRTQQELNLVQILGQSERSTLRKLILHHHEDCVTIMSSQLCELAAAALPRLPGLEYLFLHLPGADLSSRQKLMQAIRPPTSPCLTHFRWGESDVDMDVGIDAAEAPTFKESVREMLRANPRLQSRLRSLV